MKRATPIPLPLHEIQTRIPERIGDAIEILKHREKFAELPAWTQRVMLILKSQLVPKELESVISAEMSVFSEGFLFGMFGTLHDLAHHSDKNERQTARRLMTHLASNRKEKRIAKEVVSGAVLKLPKIQRHVLKRICSSNSAERRAFAEGLALGCRALELVSEKAEQGQTPATIVYFMLWIFWPEIDQMKSVGEAGRSLGLIFNQNPNLAGNWDHRFRKIANRIKLSFRAKQNASSISDRLTGG